MAWHGIAAELCLFVKKGDEGDIFGYMWWIERVRNRRVTPCTEQCFIGAE